MHEASPLEVVVIHWNQATRCADALEAVCHQGTPVHVTVVDNGSRPDEARLLRKAVHAQEGVDLVATGVNLGFGPAANVGLRRWLRAGTGEWAAVMPHDAIPGPGCLGRLLAAAGARPRAGLICADVGEAGIPAVDPYFGAITLPAPAPGWPPGRVEPDGWQAVGHPHGTLMVLRRDCVDRVGLFDERYFAYVEEADLGERARRAGWDVGLVRGARVTNPHLAGGSDVVDYLKLRNTLLLVRSHFGRYPACIRMLIALGQLGGGVLRPSRRPAIFSARARVQALADHLRGRYGPPAARIRGSHRGKRS